MSRNYSLASMPRDQKKELLDKYLTIGLEITPWHLCQGTVVNTTVDSDLTSYRLLNNRLLKALWKKSL